MTLHEARSEVVLLNWRDLSNPEGGGSELYVETIAQQLAAAGSEVTVFCAAHAKAPAEEVKQGVRYLRRGNHLTVYAWAAVLGWRGRLGRPGVIVEVQNGVPFLARLWSRAPVVVLVHHLHREQWPVVFGPVGARLGWWLESWLAPRVNAHTPYVAVSQVTRNELIGLGIERQRITVIPNGTPVGLASMQGRTSHPSIVVLGRVVPHKRIELVLEVAMRLRDELPGLRIDIAGDGYGLPVVRQQIRDRGLGDIVTVHGRVNEQTKADLLARSWVHAVPSVKEGWGLSVVEAGSHRTPSVAFRSAGGLAESIVDGQTGLLAGDLTGLHDALLAVLTEPSLRQRLGDGAHTHAARFTWAASATAFGAALTHLAVPPGHRSAAPRRSPSSPSASSSGVS